MGGNAIFVPPIVTGVNGLPDVAVVPIFPGGRDEHFCDSQTQKYDPITSPYYHYVMSGYVSFVTLFPAVFGKGRNYCILVTCFCCYLFAVYYGGTLYDTYENIWANDGNMEDEYATQLYNHMYMITLFSPIVLSVVCIWLSNRSRKIRLFFVFFGFNICAAIVFLGQQELQTSFFESTGSLITKMALKLVGQFIITTIFMDGCWRFQKHLTLHHGVPGNIGPVLLAVGLPAITISARLMSGTAETTAQALAYEISATGAELLSANALLRGKTPGRKYWKNFTWLFSKVSNKVAIEEEVIALSEEEELKATEKKATDELIEKTRLQYCADAVIMIGVCEAVSLIQVFVYLYNNPSNLAGAVGMLAVAKTQLVM